MSSRYPENLSPIRGELPERDQRFAELREDFLLGYGYQTARAYWGDLEHIHDWAVARGKDILHMEDADFHNYLTWMKHRDYSPNTIRRRQTALRAFYGYCDYASRASTHTKDEV